MADHVKNCDDCRAERECQKAVEIIAAYPIEKLLDTLPNMSAKRLRITDKKYHREYMRKWRQKHGHSLG